MYRCVCICMYVYVYVCICTVYGVVQAYGYLGNAYSSWMNSPLPTSTSTSTSFTKCTTLHYSTTLHSTHIHTYIHTTPPNTSVVHCTGFRTHYCTVLYSCIHTTPTPSTVCNQHNTDKSHSMETAVFSYGAHCVYMCVMYVHMYVCMCMCMYIVCWGTVLRRTWTSPSAKVNIHIHIHIYCTYTCTYTYIHWHTHIHTHCHTHIHLNMIARPGCVVVWCDDIDGWCLIDGLQRIMGDVLWCCCVVMCGGVWCGVAGFVSPSILHTRGSIALDQVSEWVGTYIYIHTYIHVMLFSLFCFPCLDNSLFSLLFSSLLFSSLLCCWCSTHILV